MDKELSIATYVGSWPQNIGNAFFDLGAEALLRRAFPSARITRTGGAVHWMFNNSRIGQRNPVRTYLGRYFQSKFQRNGNSLELGEIIKTDLLVFAGMSMCQEFAQNNGPTLLAASRNGVPILGVGTGASRYSKDDVSAFVDLCLKIPKLSLITRDEPSYQLVKDYLPNVHRGIDCAFFLPWYFKPLSLIESDFVMSTFDFRSEPKWVTEMNPIRAHHDLWGHLPKRYVNREHTVISDIPEDYLNLYANCRVTYSDRVHACVAALSYGNRAQLFAETPRSALFEQVGLSEIGNYPVALDLMNLEILRLNQVVLVRNVQQELTDK